MQPARGPLPVLMLTVPEVSKPFTEADPPPPKAPAIMLRPGVGPLKRMWFGISSEALPLRTSRDTVICEAVMAPLKVELPETDRSRKVVEPSIAVFWAT